MAADAAITASSLASIANAASAINQGVNEHMDRFVLETQARGAAVREGINERREETSQALVAAAAKVQARQEELVELGAREEDHGAEVRRS